MGSAYISTPELLAFPENTFPLDYHYHGDLFLINVGQHLSDIEISYSSVSLFYSQSRRNMQNQICLDVLMVSNSPSPSRDLSRKVTCLITRHLSECVISFEMYTSRHARIRGITGSFTYGNLRCQLCMSLPERKRTRLTIVIIV